MKSPTISAELKIEAKLDLDNTDDSLHGYTESRRVVFFTGITTVPSQKPNFT